MAVVGDAVVEVVLPLLVEDVVSGVGEGSGGCGAVFVSGVGDDGEFAEGAWPVGVVAEGFFAVVGASEAEEVPFGGGAAEFGA